MTDAPWQCPQCGTINEPAANACRTCGRWPSLFDLERGAVVAASEGEEGAWSTPAVETAPPEPEVVGVPEVVVGPVAAEPMAEHPEAGADEADELERPRRGRLLRSLIVPIAFAIYILVTVILGDRGE
ncbi:MAG: hypothetical protein RMM28_07465 [Thermoleophilia bacterium]|nr:hypothetical protein [Thermoleophilia bacterium]